MSRAERIIQSIKARYPACEVYVEDRTPGREDYSALVGSGRESETDLHVEVCAEEFAGLSLLEATREVNRAIKGEFAKGLHSVSIECSSLLKQKKAD